MRTIPAADGSHHARQPTIELGVCTHGPTADSLHQTLTEQILTWSRDHAAGPGPRIEVHPKDQDPTDQIIFDKRQTHLAISWPTTAI